jgi:hypothetical protein
MLSPKHYEMTSTLNPFKKSGQQVTMNHVNVLVGNSVSNIKSALSSDHSLIKFTDNLLGDGMAGQKIVKRLMDA